jgi:class 3 adenylate cyclase
MQEFLTGTRPVPEVDRVFATVLFTDIVGSTQQAAKSGDRRWRDLMESHDLAMKQEIDRFRGRQVKQTGDGVLATFDGPSRAIHCAKSMVQAARQLGVEIRAGLHAGECELLGEDIHGITVNIAARVAGLAGPGQVLVSQTVRDIVVGSGISVSDQGLRALNGVPGEWRLFSVDLP